MIGNSLWQLVVHSDTMSVIILLLLFILSVTSWSFAIITLVRLRKKIAIFNDLKIVLNNQTLRLDAIDGDALLKKNTIANDFITNQVVFFKTIREMMICYKREYNNQSMISVLEEQLYDAIDALVGAEAQGIAVFVTIAGISPLLGLLGTVWGLIHAFLQISQTQVADIVTVAPGISEALITTLAGLIVAIPALIFCNFISNRVRAFESLLETIGIRYRLLVIEQLLKDSHASL